MLEERVHRLEIRLNDLLSIPAIWDMVRAHEAEQAELRKKVAEEKAAVAARLQQEKEPPSEPIPSEEPPLPYQPLTHEEPEATQLTG